jgi:hypothetical protein
VQRDFSQILTVQRQNVEGVELDLLVVPAGMQPVEVGKIPSTPSRTASPSMTNELKRLLSPASTIRGVAFGPVSHALAFAPDNKALRVMLDLVNPVGMRLGPQSRGSECKGYNPTKSSRPRSQLACRFAAGFDFFATFAGLPAAGVRLPPAMLAFRADIRSTILSGVCLLAAVIGRPFCFLDNSSCSAAS